MEKGKIPTEFLVDRVWETLKSIASKGKFSITYQQKLSG